MPLLLSKANAWIIFGSSVVGVFLLLFIIFLICFGFRKKRAKKVNVDKVVVDEEFINKMINYLGDFKNIVNISMDNGRVKFLVNDLEALNTEGLKELSTRGVFITGNNVKLLFKYDSDAIIKALNERGVKNA